MAPSQDAYNVRNWTLSEGVNMRTYSFSDRLIGHLDRGVTTLWGVPRGTGRANPGDIHADKRLSESARKRSAGLMRVDHAGEVAAQALYQGQATVARGSTMRESLLSAAQEENDHLHWCRQRLDELGSRHSVFDPLWFCGGFGIGVVAGLLGNKVSLGFLAETEHQVVEHLDRQLEQLPNDDDKSRAILQQMRADEEQHATGALHGGGILLPGVVKRAMRVSARFMTKSAYWI